MVELRGISKIYRSGSVEFHALKELDLTIGRGEFVAIMGHSGSGKSTLLNILGFLDRPDAGTYRLNGRDISGMDDDELSTLRNHTAGFVFQQFHLLPRVSARTNVALPLIYAGNADRTRIAMEKISSVGLANRAHHQPSELSGGEQQRVAIARALVNDPPIIFADEPTGNLDTGSEAEIIAILERLNAEGKTIILVTHEEEVAAHAGRILRLRDGEIISDVTGPGGMKRRAKKTVLLRMEEQKDALTPISALTPKSMSKSAAFADYLKQALGSMKSHKLRSALSMLGILIGVAAVISMLAIGEGAKESINKSMGNLGSNLLIVRPGSPQLHGVAMEAGTVTRFTLQDARAIAIIPEVRHVSSVVNGRVQCVYGNKNWNTQVQGSDPEYRDMRAAVPISGRFFTADESKRRMKVALVGATIVRELYGGSDPVGKNIKLNRINFTIIGALPLKGATGWRDQDDLVIIPVTTAMYRLLGKEYIDQIEIEVRSPELIERAITSIKSLIMKRHRLEGEARDSFSIRDMTEIRDTMSATTRTMSILLGSMAALSLLVGGIGIMNIMLVSVKERTREIGLRKAIGARRRDILLQFLIESCLMTISGGMIGILLGTAITIIISLTAGWNVKIVPSAVLIATSFSVLVGLLFGLWPAVHASRLHPIEALRYE